MKVANFFCLHRIEICFHLISVVITLRQHFISLNQYMLSSVWSIVHLIFCFYQTTPQQLQIGWWPHLV